MVGKPTDSEQDENYNEHFCHFPHLFLGPPVRFLQGGGLPLQPPQSPAQIGVGEGEAHQGQDVGHQEVDDLVHVVHQRDVRLPVRPDQQAGGGAGLVGRVGLGGGVEESRRGQDRADTPDGDDGEAEGDVCAGHVLGAGDYSVPATCNV